MNKYEYLYVPLEDNEPIPDNAKTIGLTRYKPVENKIVLSIEDLREVWATAKESPDYPGVLELFLRSNGITI